MIVGTGGVEQNGFYVVDGSTVRAGGAIDPMSFLLAIAAGIRPGWKGFAKALNRKWKDEAARVHFLQEILPAGRPDATQWGVSYARRRYSLR